MKLNKVGLWGMVAMGLTGCVGTADNRHPTSTAVNVVSQPKVSPDSSSELFQISVEDATNTARKYLNVSKNEPSPFVVCDAGLYFRVVYTAENKEVEISRSDGRVLGERSLMRNVSAEKEVPKRLPAPVDGTEAIYLSKRHFIDFARETLGTDDTALNNYFATSCDLGQSWRVSFILNDIRNIKTKEDISKLPNHSPPDYVVDKQTGEITYFNYWKE